MRYVVTQPLSLLVPFLLLIASCVSPVHNEEEAQQVLKRFYDNREPEEINDQDLLQAGKSIVPYILKEIQREDMPKRGYAILALGKIGDKRALPVLIEMMSEDIQVDKGCVLRAIWHIDRKKGEEIASRSFGQSEHLDRTIVLLREGRI